MTTTDKGGNKVEPQLTRRMRELLRILVKEHTSSAVAVGSGTLRRVGGLDVSTATVRNDLGQLEELGYVSQPHTSAGRVPTVKGYRFFVEQLMEHVDLPVPEQRMIRHQFHQIRLNLDQWMRLTAAVLAHASRSASLVTPPHATSSRFKHTELISTQDTICLMILVLEDGSVNQEMLVLSRDINQDELSRISNKLNDLLKGRTVAEIEESTNPELADLGGREAQVLARVVHIMHKTDLLSISEVYRDGLVNVLNEPEFDDVDRFRQVFAILEHRGLLESILSKTLNASGVQIIIGGEGTYEDMDDVSLVLSPYGVRGKASGVLGVLGPIRMGYARAISTVSYVARLMDGLVSDVYGS